MTFLVQGNDELRVGASPVTEVLVLDAREARVVDLLARAGLVPELRYEVSA